VIAHYLGLALRSLKRNPALTTLMILAIAVGIATSMTTFTLLHTMSNDPIPWKSSQLFAPQIDNGGPQNRKNGEPPDQLSYRDSMALMQARKGLRQTAMYSVSFTITPEQTGTQPFVVAGRAAFADFFRMFDVPFRYGSPWSAADDEARADVVVIGARLAERLFPNANPVGRTIDRYRIVGVLQPWRPTPRFYDVSNGGYPESEDEVFIPFTTAIGGEKSTRGNNSCVKPPPQVGWQGYLESECVWTQFMVELPTAADVQRYRAFLDGYAAEQQRVGRFAWPPLTRLRSLPEWLKFNKVVPDQVRVITLLSFGFLLVCLVNAIGLMLARFSSRAAEFGVRRALGASRRDVFLQCLTETSVVGAVGGLAGLALTALGVAGERSLLPKQLVGVAQLDADLVFLTIGLAIAATVCSGLYPTWRASQVQPAWQLKAQ
jgi:putative ABC transport system permease protein